MFRLDVAELLNDLISSAAARGFTNTTDPAAPDLDAGDLFYDESQVVPNPDEYLFWDDVHPTAALHRLLGFEAIRAVLPSGDYDRSGVTDAADLDVWLTEFGSVTELASDGNSDGFVTGADYAAAEQPGTGASGGHGGSRTAERVLDAARGDRGRR